jgi:Mn2+/Fe2+ NRAMP family transporter
METYHALFGIAAVIAILIVIFIILWQTDQFENTEDAAEAAAENAGSLGWETFVAIGGGLLAVGFLGAGFYKKKKSAPTSADVVDKPAGA